MRGIDKRQEIDPSLLIRDTRTIGQRVYDFFEIPSYVGIIVLTAAAGAFLFPGISDAVFLIGVACFIYGKTRKISLPFRMPKRSSKIDYNDRAPGTNKPQQAKGIAFFGNDVLTNEELWFHNEDMRTHILIFGSTGSGKTEALISIAYNALVQGSGFIYVDGKGDNTLFSKIFSMARSMGREDDLLVINFMTGARDIVGPQEKRLSNTLNPFSTGSSSMLTQLIVSLMDSSSQNSDGDMWKGRAISFVEALMKILVYMRDQGHILLDANIIRKYFLLPQLESIVMDRLFLRDNQEPVSLMGIPEVVLEPIDNYLFNLPGYSKERKGKQVSQVLEQHGFITMQLTRAFTSLADTYGHIIRTNLAEVDFKDVVLNRRILVVLLPALEKSPDELANLGKVIVASLKAMMATALGEEVEGAYADIIQSKPTNALTPFLCILDEYGYYAVQGFSVVPAQARSLGFCAVFAGQDLPAFQKASKEEAASIGANTNIKICMKLEDPTETWEFFNKTADQAYVTKVDAFQTKDTSLTNTYLDTRSASFEKRARVDLLDLKEQREGEAHIFFKSRIVRAKMFYANPKPVKKMRLNHFLKVEKPLTKKLIDLNNQLEKFRHILVEGDFTFEQPPENEDVSFFADYFNEHSFDNPIERSVASLIAYYDREEKKQTEIEEQFVPSEAEIKYDEESEDELNIFTRMRRLDEMKKFVIASNFDEFSLPILSRPNMVQQIAQIEKVCGMNDRQAMNIANEITKDMRIATLYPPSFRDDITTSELVIKIEELMQAIDHASATAVD